MKRKPPKRAKKRNWNEAIAAAPILGIGKAPDDWPTEAEWHAWRKAKEQDARIKARVLEHIYGLYGPAARFESIKLEIREKLKAFQ